MKEMFSISSGVDVAKVKPIDSTTKETTADKSSSSKDFLSIMFAQIKESLNSEIDTKLDIKLDNKIEEKETILKTDLGNKETKKSVDEHLLDDLLKVVTLLKNQTNENEKISFPSFSNKIEKIINNELAVKELKEVKNITDLLKLSKKYDLGLEKISIKKLNLESIKNEFPKLDKNFFEIPEKNSLKIDKNIIDIKKEPEIKPTVLSVNNIEKPIKEVKKEPSLLEKMMSSSKKDENKNIEILPTDKKSIKKEAINETSQKVNKEINIIQKEVDKIVLKNEIKNNIDIKENTKIDLKEASKIIIKETTKTEVKEASKIEVKEVVKIIPNDEAKKKIEEKISSNTRINDIKVEENVPKKGLIENILQGIKTQKQNISTNESSSTILVNNLKEEIKKTENTEIKVENNLNRNEIKPQIKTDTLISKQLSPTKDTFNNFATEFKEKLENYKPPFMRVQMALNPKGLGEVDVTIVNRGNNLHVNITSNTNTMSVFTQNQAEFKNSLVNMGFTNLEMNFSDQRESKEQQNNDKSAKTYSENFEEEKLEEETTSIELLVPQYV